MAEQMTFTISRDGEQWRARWDDVPGRSLAADTRAEVEQACREYVAGYTGRPASETTILFIDAGLPTIDCNCPACREDNPFEAVNRVRALHKVCTETPLDEGGCTDGCDEPICAYDTEEWPCNTIRALDGGAL